jgi:type IV secretory pathway TrbF-like protein
LFIELFSKIYFKLSSFKHNIKTLPGDHDTFDENWVATIRLEIDEVELFLNNIASLIENGFEKTEIIDVTSMIRKLRKSDEQQFYFNIFFNGELTGSTFAHLKLPETRMVTSL